MSDQPTTPEPESTDPTSSCGGRRPSSCSPLTHEIMTRKVWQPKDLVLQLLEMCERFETALQLIHREAKTIYEANTDLPNCCSIADIAADALKANKLLSKSPEI